MFKFEEICELIRLVGSTEVASVEIEHAGARVRIDGNHPPQVVEVTTAASPAPTVASSVTTGGAPAATAEPAATAAAPAASPDEAGEEEGLHYIVSPIVGTFYRAPNPEAEPYVKVGDAIDVAKTLCIVEAMKLMNEIESDVSGTVVKVFSDNAQPVEYGERLFAIRVS